MKPGRTGTASPQANPGNVMAAEAHLQLASVQMARGSAATRADVAASHRGGVRLAAKNTWTRCAHAHFATARETFNEAEATYSAELEKLPPTDTDPKGDASEPPAGIPRRVSRSCAIWRHKRSSKRHAVYPPEADEYRELQRIGRQRACRPFTTNSAEALTRLSVSMRGCAEGRCYQALGEYPIALGCYEDILAQPNVLPPFRKLIASARRSARPKFSSHSGEVSTRRSKLCRCLPARRQGRRGKAARMDRRAIPPGRSAAEERRSGWPELARWPQAAGRGPRRLSRSSPIRRASFKRRRARPLSARRPRTSDGRTERKDDPKTFQAAYDLGKDALASYNAAKLAMPSAERNNPEAVPELASADGARQRGRARDTSAPPSTLVEDDTDLKLLNEVRYFLCWLYWESQDYYRAAVLGEFLARRYPDHPAAASAAKLAMALVRAALQPGARQAGDEADTDFEARRMAEMAEFIARRWPGTDDADAAQSVLVSYAIRNDRIEDAEKLLAEASARVASAARAAARQRDVGTIPRTVAAAVRNAAGCARRCASSKQSAVKYLRSGFDAARKERDAERIGRGRRICTWSKRLLSDEKYDEAIELLEDDRRSARSTLVVARSTRPHPGRNLSSKPTRPRCGRTCYDSPPQEKKALAIMKSLEKRELRRAAARRRAAHADLHRPGRRAGEAGVDELRDCRARSRTRHASARPSRNSSNRIAARQETRIGPRASGSPKPTTTWAPPSEPGRHSARLVQPKPPSNSPAGPRANTSPKPATPTSSCSPTPPKIRSCRPAKRPCWPCEHAARRVPASTRPIPTGARHVLRHPEGKGSVARRAARRRAHLSGARPGGRCKVV